MARASAVASAGGTCSAYLGSMLIGQGGLGSGTVDLSAMNSVAIDADLIELSSNRGNRDAGKGYLYLPLWYLPFADGAITWGQEWDLRGHIFIPAMGN
jgi:hypothetical protein